MLLRSLFNPPRLVRSPSANSRADELVTGSSQASAVAFRKAARSMIIYSLGILAGRLASIILVPLYTHYLTQDEYGTLELLDVTLQAITKVLWGGFPYAVWYFYAKHSDAEGQNRVVRTSLLGSLVVGSSGTLVTVALAPFISMLIWHSSDKVGLLRIMFASLACGLPLDALLCCLRISDEPTKYVGIG